MNNTVIEIKNTLEWEVISSRITEPEECVSELEDTMVEMTAEEHKREKELKELSIVSENSGAIEKHQLLNYRDPRRREEKERVWEYFWRDYSWKLSHHGQGNSQFTPRSSESPTQDKSKEKHAKMHTNQIKKLKQRKQV